jgi:hypothetical protein
VLALPGAGHRAARLPVSCLLCHDGVSQMHPDLCLGGGTGSPCCSAVCNVPAAMLSSAAAKLSALRGKGVGLHAGQQQCATSLLQCSCQTQHCVTAVTGKDIVH